MPALASPKAGTQGGRKEVEIRSGHARLMDWDGTEHSKRPALIKSLDPEIGTALVGCLR